MCAARMPCARNPGATPSRRQRTRSSSPAPTSSTSAIAISATTRDERARPDSRSPAVRPEERRREKWRPEACQAGAIPKSTLVASEAANVKAATRPFGPTFVSRGRASGNRESSASTPQALSRKPTTPPASARTPHSVRIWVRMRRREAPSAARIESSPERARTLVIWRLARLAHAIMRTSPTAATRIDIARRLSPTTFSSSGVRAGSSPLSYSGWSRPSSVKAAPRSARAASFETPGLRRKTGRRKWTPRSGAAVG